MARGRPRTPTTILDAKGAFTKHPERKRARENEPQPEGEIGDPPDFLRDDDKESWQELVAIAPYGVLTDADRPMMVGAAKVYTVMKQLNSFEPKLHSQFLAYLSKMGLTPADRSRVQVTKKKPKQNPYAEFKMG